MKTLVIGGGAREHALVWRLSRDRRPPETWCAPGNPVIARDAVIPRDGRTASPEDILALAERFSVDLTVIGPEAPLDQGVVDLFTTRGRAILGPTRAAARLETSKAFAKQFMLRHGVPTARFEVCGSPEEALGVAAREEFAAGLVVKADGLAAGKGVVVTEDRSSAEAAIRAAMIDRVFGAAGARVVLEERLVGVEASVFALCDGRRAVPFFSAQDHKRIGDDDVGPNTGGMGAIAPSPFIDERTLDGVMRTIVQPTLDGMRAEGCPFRGFLYAGLMLTSEGPKVIEFNVRLGDPEAQVVLPALETDLAPALWAAANGDLRGADIRFSRRRFVGVVAASRGYPGPHDFGKAISGIEEAAGAADALVFVAGAEQHGDRIVTSGGRVLTVVGSGNTFAEARTRAYNALHRIAFDGKYTRSDIGRKAHG